MMRILDWQALQQSDWPHEKDYGANLVSIEPATSH
jgi:hypothetical protein